MLPVAAADGGPGGKTTAAGRMRVASPNRRTVSICRATPLQAWLSCVVRPFDVDRGAGGMAVCLAQMYPESGMCQTEKRNMLDDIFEQHTRCGA